MHYLRQPNCVSVQHSTTVFHSSPLNCRVVLPGAVTLVWFALRPATWSQRYADTSDASQCYCVHYICSPAFLSQNHAECSMHDSLRTASSMSNSLCNLSCGSKALFATSCKLINMCQSDCFTWGNVWHAPFASHNLMHLILFLRWLECKVQKTWHVKLHDWQKTNGKYKFTVKILHYPESLT